MTITIRTIGGRELYVAEGATDIRAALVAAVKSKADLRWANLRWANLHKADLSEAYLRWANLRGANLSEAATSMRHPLHNVALDLWTVLDQAPAEVPGLRAALVEGRVNGSAYTGECACLVGTIANVRGVAIDDLEIHRDSSRPAEQWFLPIMEGDASVEDLATADREGVFRATVAVAWIDAWAKSRARLVAALTAAADA